MGVAPNNDNGRFGATLFSQGRRQRASVAPEDLTQLRGFDHHHLPRSASANEILHLNRERCNSDNTVGREEPQPPGGPKPPRNGRPRHGRASRSHPRCGTGRGGALPGANFQRSGAAHPPGPRQPVSMPLARPHGLPSHGVLPPAPPRHRLVARIGVAHLGRPLRNDHPPALALSGDRNVGVVVHERG